MEALIGTAHDACSRKVHAAAKGYFHDPFAQYFQRDTTMINSPLMNRGHWLRVKAVENTLRYFAKLYPGENLQVLSVGAGMDTLYFKWAEDHTLGGGTVEEGDPEGNGDKIDIVKYVEIDFADLVEDKTSIIKKTPKLNELVTDPAAEGIYQLVAGDLLSHDSIMNICKEHLNPALPTIVIAECVFVYIDVASTTALLNLLCNEFFAESEKLVMFTYDAMGPHDRFGEMMLKNLAERQIFLKGIEDLPTTAAHEQRAKEVGFKSVKAWSMKQLYFGVPKKTQTFLNKIEMIDDWDEWNLVHEHYCILVGWKGGDGSVPPIFA